FSLGAVFYELLSGTKAFEGRTLADIDRAVLEDKARPVHELNPAVPQDLSELVSRLIARDPAQRFTCATELVSTLRAWSAAHGSAHGSTTRRGAPPTSAAVPKGVPGAGLAVRAGQRDALVEADEVRRGVDMHPPAGGLLGGRGDRDGDLLADRQHRQKLEILARVHGSRAGELVAKQSGNLSAEPHGVCT
ncbi:MAG TPA: hypothetical protein PLF63_07270, partial [Rubrivivax sp.]|nr:hypothetical protein [Rubrivivax sp.]